MKDYKGYSIPEKDDLKIEGIVIPMGGNLMVKISDNAIFDSGINPSEVHNMSDDEFNNLLFSRASGYIDMLESKN